MDSTLPTATAATAAASSASATPTGTSVLQLIVLKDESLSGILLWIVVLAVGSVAGLALFEILRRDSKLSHVFYTRCKIMPSHAPEFPCRPFSWIWTAIATPDRYIQDNVGLDAFMFLSYMRMSFQLFAVMAVLLFFILLPVNFQASGKAAKSVNITTPESVLLVATTSLELFSIDNVADGSSILWIHVVSAYAVSFLTFYLLFHCYKAYSEAISSVLSGRAHVDRSQEVMFRTVLFTNLPTTLRREPDLHAWLQSVEIGEIESVCMVAEDDATILKLMKRREKVLRQLEKAYMAWAINISRELRIRRYGRMFGWMSRFLRVSPESVQKLHTHQLDLPPEELTHEFLARTRPKTKNQEAGGPFSLTDSIRKYDSQLMNLTERIIWLRTKAVATSALVRESPIFFQGMSPIQPGNSDSSAKHAPPISGAIQNSNAISVELEIGTTLVVPSHPRDLANRRISGHAADRMASTDDCDDIESSEAEFEIKIEPPDQLSDANKPPEETAARTSDHAPAGLPVSIVISLEAYNEFNASSCAAFVTFSNRRAAFMAQQLSLAYHSNPFTMRVQPAPEPKDVIWSSLSLSLMQTVIKRAIFDILAYTICIGWVIPTSFISSLTQMDDLTKFPKNREFVTFLMKSPLLHTLVVSVFPPLTIQICNMCMPLLFEWLTQFQGMASTYSMQRSLLAKYFFFLLLNVQFVYTIFSSAWSTSSNIFLSPLSWLENIATSLPAGTSFFINYLLLNLILTPFELLRPWPCITFLLGRWWRTTPREYYELDMTTSMLNYGYLFPIQIMLFVIVLCYSIIAPLVLLPGAIYFGVSWIIYKNQMLFVYAAKTEYHGRMWLMAFNRSILGLLMFQFTTAGLIASKSAPIAATFCGALVVATWLFYELCRMSFDRHTHYAPLDSLVDPEILDESDDLQEDADQDNVAEGLHQSSQQTSPTKPHKNKWSLRKSFDSLFKPRDAARKNGKPTESFVRIEIQQSDARSSHDRSSSGCLPSPFVPPKNTRERSRSHGHQRSRSHGHERSRSYGHERSFSHDRERASASSPGRPHSLLASHQGGSGSEILDASRPRGRLRGLSDRSARRVRVSSDASNSYGSDRVLRSHGVNADIGLSLASLAGPVANAEEHAERSKTVSYMSPAYSTPLAEPWIPEYISRIVREFGNTQGPEDMMELGSRGKIRSGSYESLEVVIVSAARTPTGAFQKSLAKLRAPELGAVAIKAAVERAGLKPDQVEEVFMGNVVSAGVGQSPARQAALLAGLTESTEATTVNKVCASGLKAVMFATQSLQLGDRHIMVAGGMESMSNVPFYFPRGAQYGHQQSLDGIIKDGLWDVYNNVHMGNCAEETAVEYKISREEQDDHAINSYKRAAAAWAAGRFNAEIAPITIKDKKGDKVISEDEGYKNVDFSRVSSLRPAFQKDGTVTAANASTLNDGASALVLMTRQRADELGIKPLARVLGYADAACAPKKFTIAPSLAIPKALKHAGLSLSDIDLFEINEAFSVVIRANEKILGLDPAKVNVAGGGVSLGHPIGSSGSRILVTLVHLLNKGQVGLTAICNGGGAASSLIIERL
ncbi:hypothetical protein HK105_201621 [Polyrhizophydium stewartii]|uniref:acetyl-CoA C-acetyltransferase n=1 Tax=Polyrhizophydium stewartii TaxID=2732419 RepID=A0ABR4NGW9_9FUNG